MIEVLSMVAAMVLQAEGPEGKSKEGLPLESTRRIEFTTDEATWLSLDVSPDGQNLFLEIAGDLYTLPIEGGEARAVLTGPPFESQPRFSPDGKWVVFLSDATVPRTCGSRSRMGPSRRSSPTTRTPSSPLPPGPPTAAT